MELHKLLKRQLARTGLNERECSSDSKKWQEFLACVNRGYHEVDQERYLLERSMEISSREMSELNRKLETAQRIAHLGYWNHDVETGENSWSKELYTMFGLDYAQEAPSLEKVLNMVHEQDRDKLKNLINTALTTGKDYEIEMRMKGFGKRDKYYWYLVKGHPIQKTTGSIHQLTGIAMDITQRKQIEKQVAVLHQQLLITARNAGMAEVATSILHNIGNVLNSANVAIGVIYENITAPYFNKLYEIELLLNTNASQLIQFISEDPKGKFVIPYLCEIIIKIKYIQSSLMIEIADLREHLNHIKDITAMQKSISGISAMIEKVPITELIDSAIKMTDIKFKRNEIQLIKQYKQKCTISTDKSKVLQILINLIQNARDSLVNLHEQKQKQIIIKLEQTSNFIEISVKDNGEGILQENLTRIFSMGFTTKENGHGFGLHSSAISAKELGGSIKVESEGIGKGATFILVLPHNAPKRRKGDEQR